MDSIFLTIKKVLGVDASFAGFDDEILLDINTSLMALSQMGIGPQGGFIVTGEDETWDELLGAYKNLEGVKTYIQLKTRLLFDPPSNSFVLEAFNREIQEIAYRANTQAEINNAPPVPPPPEGEVL